MVVLGAEGSFLGLPFFRFTIPDFSSGATVDGGFSFATADAPSLSLLALTSMLSVTSVLSPFIGSMTGFALTIVG